MQTLRIAAPSILMYFLANLQKDRLHHPSWMNSMKMEDSGVGIGATTHSYGRPNLRLSRGKRTSNFAPAAESLIVRELAMIQRAGGRSGSMVTALPALEDMMKVAASMTTSSERDTGMISAAR
jgi:hypothetical protein